MKCVRATLAATALAATALLGACGSTPSPPTPTVDGSSTRAGTMASTSHATSGLAKSSAAVGAPVATPTPAVTESNPPGDIPDNQAYVAYTASPAGAGAGAAPARASVKIPEGWARAGDGTRTTFTDKLNSIQVKVSLASSAPTPASVTSQDVPALAASVPKFALHKVETVTRAGSRVTLLTYEGDSAADPVTGKVVRDAAERYTYVHGGTRLDLTLSGPVNADNVDPWRLVSDSVRWLS